MPKLYRDLADWWPVLSAPEEYEEEAAAYLKAITEASEIEIRAVLELGSGGGNNASHLKANFEMTLVDLSPGMLDVSRSLNPECEHVHGDMRTVRLGREFDAVFIHDAVGYMTCAEDLRAAIRTAHLHCRPGGVALFAPDYTKESFRPETGHGGHDRGSRSMRYLEWARDPNPHDSTYETFMVYALREGSEYRVVEDLHLLGLFSEKEWLGFLGEAGFEARAVPFRHSGIEREGWKMFPGVKRRV